MKKKILPLFSATIIACFVCICFAEQVEWENGGPKYLYIKSGEIPPRHSVSYPYDEQMKCMDCHKYDGVDAYTSATECEINTRDALENKEEPAYHKSNT